MNGIDWDGVRSSKAWLCCTVGGTVGDEVISCRRETDAGAREWVDLRSGRFAVNLITLERIEHQPPVTVESVLESLRLRDPPFSLGGFDEALARSRSAGRIEVVNAFREAGLLNEGGES